jgi:hypothetical protein
VNAVVQAVVGAELILAQVVRGVPEVLRIHVLPEQPALPAIPVPPERRGVAAQGRHIIVAVRQHRVIILREVVLVLLLMAVPALHLPVVILPLRQEEALEAVIQAVLPGHRVEVLPVVAVPEDKY